MKKIILTTGGTGGHVFPALAVAQEIKDRCPDCEILFIGGQGPEKEMVQRAGLEFKALPAKGVVGGGIKKILSSGWIVKSFLLAMKEIKAFRPDAIIGFGGYAGFCPVLAGRVLGTPTAIHEQNSVPGVTNRILGKVVNKIFASFENSAGAFPAGKIEVTGNPVRKEIFRCGRSANGKTVLVVGGSQGAHPINRALVAALPKFKDAGVTLNHQTGKADYDKVCAEYEKAGMNPAQVSAFIHDMACAYAQAQLVICRAGASTVFEIAAAGKPAVFIPFPQATHDHQTGNAMNLAKIGAALVIPQGELSGDALADKILELISDQEKLTEMGSKALSFARPDAASAIVDGVLNIIRMKRGAA